MNYDEYITISSEINELQSLLAEIPEENVIERMGLEDRLKSAQAATADVQDFLLTHKARLTFRGKPVFGSHGIAADFAAKAAGAFTDAVAAVAAGLAENLHYMGRIPDKQKNQLLITGTAIGSFGFEFELPQPENNLFPATSNAENALDKMQKLFQVASEGNDDELAELVTEIHPRAVKKAAEFLNYIAQQEAWCGLEFKDESFRFKGIEQLRESQKRLEEDNIRETKESFNGEFMGVLPQSRNFEFKCEESKDVLRGKVAQEIEDPDILNRDFLHKSVTVTLQVIQVGQGRPRYILQSLPGDTGQGK